MPSFRLAPAAGEAPDSGGLFIPATPNGVQWCLKAPIWGKDSCSMRDIPRGRITPPATAATEARAPLAEGDRPRR